MSPLQLFLFCHPYITLLILKGRIELQKDLPVLRTFMKGGQDAQCHHRSFVMNNNLGV